MREQFFFLPFKGKSFSIADILDASSDDLQEIFRKQVEVQNVIALLKNVGLSYLKLGRTLDTLSGSELQRLKFVNFLKHHRKDKTKVLVLDEVTTGLHPKDVGQLITFLHQLTAEGFTIITVDHNPNLIAQADYNIDIGPGAGSDGG
ncbi:MAG: hypothetical protein Q4E09_05515 [Eubacteriales bacterium]|nr:hypothetical protein [Eubacteriales bacterium]